MGNTIFVYCPQIEELEHLVNVIPWNVDKTLEFNLKANDSIETNVNIDISVSSDTWRSFQKCKKCKNNATVYCCNQETKKNVGKNGFIVMLLYQRN